MAVAPVSGTAGAVRRIAFGLPLELDERIALPGLLPRAAGGAHGPMRRPTRVRIDPDGIERAWAGGAGSGGLAGSLSGLGSASAAAAGSASGSASAPRAGAVERVRELRVGDTLLLSVDHAPAVGYLLHAPGRGRVLVAPDGLDVRCDPEPGADDFAALVPAQVLPLAATLRGLEVLHAAGVQLGRGVVLLAGEPGAGKTSLAAALTLRGGRLLSDDAVALERHDDVLLAHPGSGVLQLRAQEWERLAVDERVALRPLAGVGGRGGAQAAVAGDDGAVVGARGAASGGGVAGAARGAGSSRDDAAAGARPEPKRRCTPPMATGPARVAALCLLERSGDADAPALERVERVDPFALLATTFNLSVRTPARLARHLDLCAALAAGVPVHRLRVQPGVDATALAAIVAERLGEP